MPTQAPGTSTGAYLGRREALVLLALQLAGRLNLSDQARPPECFVLHGLQGRSVGRTYCFAALSSTDAGPGLHSVLKCVLSILRQP